MSIPSLTKKMILIIGISSLVFIVAAAVYYIVRHDPLAIFPFVLGTVLGSGLTVYKLVLLERAVEKAVAMESKDAGNYIRLNHLLRFLLTAVVLLLGALTPFISLWGVAAGIFTLQISTFFIKYFLDKEEKENSTENIKEDGQDEKA